jgi:hypothetical protein
MPCAETHNGPLRADFKAFPWAAANENAADEAIAFSDRSHFSRI